MSNGDILDFGNVKQYKLPTITRYFQKYDRIIKSERLVKLNLDAVAEEGLGPTGKDFLVTNPIAIDKDGNKTDDGIFSPKFGYSQFDDCSDNDSAYRCLCGKLSGAIFLGEACEECGTAVQFMDADLTIRGWIPLDEYVIINPSMYTHLVSLIRKAELEEILKINSFKMNVDGNIKSDIDPKKPYHNIGIMNFYNKIDEILDFYYALHPNAVAHYYILKENIDAIFTHYIPVYSAILRPMIANNEKVRSFKANKIYGTIMNHYQLISTEKQNMFAVLPALHEIQEEVNDLYDQMIETYSGKEGLLRGMFAGMRVDMSGRATIVPGPDLYPNQIDIPYRMAVVFLELELIFLLCLLDGITESDAYQIVNSALRVYNPRVQTLVQNICDKSVTKVHMLINRQPTLSDRNIRLMQVRKIGTDINDLSVRLPASILSGANADHDGDSLSFTPVKDERLIKTFEQTLSPVFNYISRTDGRYSPKMNYIKDYAIILSNLYSLSTD